MFNKLADMHFMYDHVNDMGWKAATATSVIIITLNTNKSLSQRLLNYSKLSVIQHVNGVCQLHECTVNMKKSLQEPITVVYYTSLYRSNFKPVCHGTLVT
jgi:hypothetical protein